MDRSQCKFQPLYKSLNLNFEDESIIKILLYLINFGKELILVESKTQINHPAELLDSKNLNHYTGFYWKSFARSVRQGPVTWLTISDLVTNFPLAFRGHLVPRAVVGNSSQPHIKLF